jgi:decaprenylphospho-beta-D-ribofuranose 2-oxidase
MQQFQQKIANWALFPTTVAKVSVPESFADVGALIQSSGQLLARGNGRCYGDAALSGHVVSILRLNRILQFDATTGEIDCEAGVLLQDILALTLPAGWFFHVTPGIKLITVGGAVASDVHGKNHPQTGCFSNYIIHFNLMQADGTVVTCSHTQNADLFWQTCGGMGWTGIILSVKFKLKKINSLYMRQQTVHADNLATLLDTVWHAPTAYAAAWLDGSAETTQLGRGIAYLADHEENGQITPQLVQQVLFPGKLTVPFFAPNGLLNRWTIKVHDAWYRFRHPEGQAVIDLNQYFYPLDQINHWNRLYGPRGFVQYQFCLPKEQALAGFTAILKTVAASHNRPFLSVLKRHGMRRVEAIHSFPIEGFSLAMDFPKTSTIFDLVKQLDQLLDQFGGKIYLTKDACSAPHLGRVDPRTFGHERFHSMLKARLLKI